MDQSSRDSTTRRQEEMISGHQLGEAKGVSAESAGLCLPTGANAEEFSCRQSETSHAVDNQHHREAGSVDKREFGQGGQRLLGLRVWTWCMVWPHLGQHKTGGMAAFCAGLSPAGVGGMSSCRRTCCNR